MTANPSGDLAWLVVIAIGLTAAVCSTAAFGQDNEFAVKVLGYHMRWQRWTDPADRGLWDHLTNLGVSLVVIDNPDYMT